MIYQRDGHDFSSRQGLERVCRADIPIHRPCRNRRFVQSAPATTGRERRLVVAASWAWLWSLWLVTPSSRRMGGSHWRRQPCEYVAVSDTAPVPELTKYLTGKLFGDKGYIGKKLDKEFLRRELTIMNRVRSNIKSLPVSFFDKSLLNWRNIVETIIGHIKEFSSLRLPKHRSVFNAFTHITAALISYQINPLSPQPIKVKLP
ncbi:hypothetical protein CCP2SC5_1000002 [Azospirillaceae bacterium]